MPWSNYQMRRILFEKGILNKYFPNRVSWISPNNKTKVEVKMTSNSNRNYVLRITLTQDFPNACPDLLVISPQRLSQRDGSALPYNSQEFHTLSNPRGLVSICHHLMDEWTSENTMYQVFMKGRLWIEAYEGHLATGRNVDYYLRHMQPNPRT